MKILDNAGHEVTLDELNARAVMWHEARRHPDAYWSAFYAKRDAAIDRDRRRTRRGQYRRLA